MNSYQCYKILGLKDGASIKELKSTYRRLALKSHPDKNYSDKDGNEFKLITEAYQTLRAEYKVLVKGKNHGKNNNKDFGFNSDYIFGKNSWGAKGSDRNSDYDWNNYTKRTENAYQDFWSYYEKSFWEYYENVKSEAGGRTEPSRKEEDLTVTVNVDPGKCIACCSCETIAPSVFQVDKNVKVNPKSKVINEKGAKSGKILDAAQTCPTKAISVMEKESCRRLYPW